MLMRLRNAGPEIALIALAITLSFIASGCATYKLAQGPIEVSYVLASDYHQAQLTAINVLADPNVPDVAKDVIRKADAAGTPAIKAVADAAKQYGVIKAEIDAIKAAGGDVPEAKILQAQASLTALRAAITNAQPIVQQLIAAIRGI